MRLTTLASKSTEELLRMQKMIQSILFARKDKLIILLVWEQCKKDWNQPIDCLELLNEIKKILEGIDLQELWAVFDRAKNIYNIFSYAIVPHRSDTYIVSYIYWRNDRFSDRSELIQELMKYGDKSF